MGVVGNNELVSSFDPIGNDLNFLDSIEDASQVNLSMEMNELKESETTVMFIFTSLKISLNMSHNQVGGLLANKHKFLIQMCIQGLKGKNFTMIINWYKLINSHFSTLMLLLQKEPDQVKHTLDVLKCGLFSKNAELTITTCQLLTRIIALAVENDLEDLRFNYLEWLTMAKKLPTSKPPKSPTKTSKYGSEKKQKAQFDHLLTETGLKAFIRAYNRHLKKFIEPFGTFIKQAGKDSYIDLITNHLRIQAESNFTFLGII